jgi:hypothetical protein
MSQPTTPLLINDTIITWNPSRLKEIEEAKKEFLQYRSLGHVIIKIDGSRMTSFEPSAGQITVLAEKIKESTMKILNEKGDEKITWTKENGKQAKKAKEKFMSLLDKEYKAFSVGADGKKKAQITEFDVDAEVILMIPPTSRG